MELSLMKGIIRTNSVTLAGEEFRINAQSLYGQGCFKPILTRIHQCMEALLSYHCKIFVIQFVLHQHEFSPTNAPISRLLNAMRKRVMRHYRLSRMVTGWVRETGSSQKPHYHLVIMLDGNKVNRQGNVMELIRETVKNTGFSHPSFNNKTYMLLRNAREKFHEAFYHLSYLAKVATKGNRPKATNDYSFSRLKMNPAGCALDPEPEVSALDRASPSDARYGEVNVITGIPVHDNQVVIRPYDPGRDHTCSDDCGLSTNSLSPSDLPGMGQRSPHFT